MTPWPSNTEKQADVHDVHGPKHQRACVVLVENSRREENPYMTDDKNREQDQSQGQT